jgi:4-diphosphocytidyl-2-C-methyl-D-erythritol kinase
VNFANADVAAWVTLAPAKVNLDLRLRGVRADGYHLLTTMLQSIALADRLVLRHRAGPFGLTCATPGVPTDARNLAWQGAAAMAAALGVGLDDCELVLEKEVPAEAGLGGGSADAVAAARLVAAAVGEDVGPERLASVVRPLGADVAFFAWGGTMRGEGIGDELTELADEPPGQVLLVRPPFGVSTKEAYGWYDADDARTPGRFAPRGALALGNDLEGPVADRHPAIAAIVARLRGADARVAAMSGSVSACFGVFGPDTDLTALEHGWPDGTRTWRTTLVSRAGHALLTRCAPLAGPPSWS